MQMVGQRQHQINLKANVKPRNLYRRQHDGQHLCKPKQHRPVSMTTTRMMMMARMMMMVSMMITVTKIMIMMMAMVMTMVMMTMP